MKKTIHKIGKFYSKIIMKYIGIFLFIGFSSVLFGKNGWIPNESLNQISGLAYSVVIPCLIGYAAGENLGGDSGGVVGVLATIGMIVGNDRMGILGAMILGPMGGLSAKIVIQPVIDRTKASLQMLVRNILLAVLGGICCMVGFFLLAPVLGGMSAWLSHALKIMIAEKWIVLSSVLIEPAKVLFLNNGINHAILTPLGIQQVEESGKSILFLLETNPGPGMGLLLSLLCYKKTRKEQYATGLFVQGIGGIHEVYFPFVLSELRLLIALIAGGMVGTFCFAVTGVGLRAPISPGSLITLFLMADLEDYPGLMLGVAASAAAAFAVGWLMLAVKKKNAGKLIMEEEKEKGMSPIHKIGFVCDGGVGSSVMGAALFRKKAAQRGMEGLEVKAYAVDQIPDGLEMIVCQKDFADMIPESCQTMELFALDNLVSSESYGNLLDEIQKRNG
ncbi:PTS mannitol transporter subunit IICB [Hespellia stercorisuis]|uniref:PTS system, mannitol-specific IIC component n=1 Tax=Hespellia stercorisuis DSM 15480 TaxID=1121950 RepID=A0A1M6U0U8_9FIRM|nr:PTS mannitol transporter subunit IICB [Hespellia stercorisuis]SHK62922.1 PTS system, mannitol-specific IIC component [Hespellia stercorisuis DSM 15480]